MKNKFKRFDCVLCGAEVKQQRGPGRVAEFRRGLNLPVPDSFEIPTCVSCGEQYFTVELGKQLETAQEPYYVEWQRQHCAPLVACIRETHGVSMREVEKACGVTGTYLSHVVNGTKEASTTLIRLLEAFANHPTEFRRHLEGRTSLTGWANLPSPALAYVAPPRTAFGLTSGERGHRLTATGSILSVVQRSEWEGPVLTEASSSAEDAA